MMMMVLRVSVFSGRMQNDRQVSNTWLLGPLRKLNYRQNHDLTLEVGNKQLCHTEVSTQSFSGQRNLRTEVLCSSEAVEGVRRLVFRKKDPRWSSFYFFYQSLPTSRQTADKLQPT